MAENAVIKIRSLTPQDIDEIVAATEQSYSSWEGMAWSKEELTALVNTFPEGQLIVTNNEKIIGGAFTIVVQEKSIEKNHTYNQIVDDYNFKTHNPTGDILYGIDVFVLPEYRGMRIGRRLYDARKDLCEQLNLKAIIFGGRIPNYHKYADQLKPREYIEQVRLKEIDDPVLNFQLSNDFHVKKVMKNYLPDDKESHEHAILLRWDNIYYEPETESFSAAKKSTVRLGLVQWQMRPYNTLDEVFTQIEYFVDAVSGYNSDFVLFPEYFNAPLMAEFNYLSEAEAIRELAKYTEEIKNRFIKLAVQYNINIITGSMPEIRKDEHLYNVGFLCRRDGSYEQYEKIHITPDEVKCWGLKGGDQIQTFETDCGPIGILICYDVEFPELSRMMALEGMNILFVPFLTDTQNAYSRVRHCAQARAVENECYVALAGSVGNLPKVENMDIQYAQSVVFTPCDFAFPTNGIKAEATPNTEMILIADVDIDALTELHTYGSVNTLRDRRPELYSLKVNNGKTHTK